MQFGKVVKNKSDIAITEYTATYDKFNLAQFSSTFDFPYSIAILRAFVKKHNYLPFYVGSEMHSGNGVVMLYSKFISKSLKNKLDLLVMSTFESGFFDYWREKRLLKTQEIFSFEENNFQSISLHNLKGIYIILFFGLIISGFCFIFEIINKKFNSTQRCLCVFIISIRVIWHHSQITYQIRVSKV